MASRLPPWADLSRARDASVHLYSAVVPLPGVSAMHCWRVRPCHAAAWARLRSGSSSLSAHWVSGHCCSTIVCSLCSSAPGDIWHALAVCPALATQRSEWWSVVGVAFNNSVLADVSPAHPLQFFFASSPQNLRILVAHGAFAYAIENAYTSQRVVIPCI